MRQLNRFDGELAAIYARVTSSKQAEEDTTNLAMQVSACRDYAERVGLTVPPDAIARDAHTAQATARPQRDALLAVMRQRGIHHLIMDRVDRVTRQGQLTAAAFLQPLASDGILLHLADLGIVVTTADPRSVTLFLQMAALAEGESQRQAGHAEADRRAPAQRRGHHARGNRPPYGFRYAVLARDARGRVTDFQLVPDDEPGGTYPILLRILREHLAGESDWSIAKRLTAEGVPTSRARAGHQHASTAWSHTSIRAILAHPVVVELATSLRQRQEAGPPHRVSEDVSAQAHETPIPLPERLARLWRHAFPPETGEAAPSARHRVEAESHRMAAIPQPDHVQVSADRVEAVAGAPGERTRRAPVRRPRGSTTPLALFSGGVMRHGLCGGSLHPKVKTNPSGKRYANYSCTIHDMQPSRCPGIHIPAHRLDTLVWDALRALLLTPGRLEELADAQRQHALTEVQEGWELAETPDATLHRLYARRDDLLAQRENLASSIATTSNAYVRRTLEDTLAALEPALAGVGQRLAHVERLVADEEARQALVVDVRTQVERYARLLSQLHRLPAEQRVPFQRRIVAALGLMGTVDKDPESGRLHVKVLLDLAAGRRIPWFAPLPGGDSNPEADLTAALLAEPFELVPGVRSALDTAPRTEEAAGGMVPQSPALVMPDLAAEAQRDVARDQQTLGEVGFVPALGRDATDARDARDDARA